MTSTPTRLLSIGLLVLAACTPSASGSASPGSPSPGVPSPSTPVASPSAEPSQGAACPVVEQSGPLATDTVTDIRIETTPTADLVTFILGERTTAPTTPTAKISAIEPPFSDGGSGQPVEVPGTYFVEIRLEGIMNSDDDGNPTYEGEYRFEPNLPALQGFVNVDAFEGHFTWIGGYVGSGCVTLLPNAAAGTFVISFGH